MDGLSTLKDKYPNFEVGLKCILMVNPYLLVCSYIKWKSDVKNNAHECYLARRHWTTRDPYSEL